MNGISVLRVTNKNGYFCWINSVFNQLLRKHLYVIIVDNNYIVQFYKGVRQGCTLSPYLFNIVAEVVMREALNNFTGGLRIRGRLINNLRYADDTVLVATSLEDLQELLNRIIHTGHKFGLIVNKGKTKVMATGGRVLDIKIDGEVLQQVDQFTYLGAIITANGDCGVDIKARIGLVKNVLFKLTGIWSSKAIMTSTKINLPHESPGVACSYI